MQIKADDKVADDAEKEKETLSEMVGPYKCPFFNISIVLFTILK